MTQPTRPPQSIHTLGTLNLVFAGLGVLGLVMSYFLYFGDLKLTPGRDPLMEIAHGSPEFMAFMRASLVAGALSIVALAAAGIGLRRMKSWGRKLSIAYSVYAILAAIGGLIMTHHYLLEPLSHVGSVQSKAGAAGGYMGGIIAMAYPIVLLIFMSRRNVREAFTRANEPQIPPAQVR